MSTSQMIANGTAINNGYNTIKSLTYGSYDVSNNGSPKSIAQSINNQLAIGNISQPLLSIANNINQENLAKRDQLLKMENDDLMNQLRELELIQSNISNKNTMLDQINTNIMNEQTNINTLIGCIILAIILLVVIVAYGYQKIDKSLMILLVIIIAVCYVILFFYSYNIFYLNTAWKNLFNPNTEARLGKALQTWSTDIKTGIHDTIYGTEQSWISANCACPASEENEETPLLPYTPGISVNPQPGYFYYDGSAPPQLIVPNNPAPSIPSSSNPFNPFMPSQNMENIDWVDYSRNGQIKSYNPVSYNNNNYYNYKSDNPQNQLQEAIDTPNGLVNSTTTTINL